MSRGAKIGENRFRTYVNLCTAEREERLLSIVIELQREKVFFNSLTSMSHYVARKFNDRISLQGKKITNTTILRNPRYKNILLKLYLDNTKLIDGNIALSENLQLRLENDRLNKHLIKSELEIAKLGRKLIQEQNYSRVNENSSVIRSLDACYKIILSILEGSNGMFVICENGIVDNSNLYNNILVSKKLLHLSGITKYLNATSHSM